jgi:hypothetical protein
LYWITSNCNETPRLVVLIDECLAVDAVTSLPADGIIGVGFLDVDRNWVPVIGESRGELVCRVQNPGVRGLGGKQNQRPDADNATIMLGGAMLDRDWSAC